MSFGAFNIVDSTQTAYLEFLKAETAWQDGTMSDADYLAALQVYVSKLTVGTSNRINAEQRLEETTYRVNRNTLVAGVNDGTATWEDLMAFDAAAMEGLNQSSQTYLERRDRYRQSQSNYLADAAQAMVDRYQAGQMTAVQLQSWYEGQLNNPLLANNPELFKKINEQIESLRQRVISEVDSRMVQDYTDGKTTPEQFLAYAVGARSRYVTGTPQADDWDRRIAAAQRDQAETGLLYRYNLSQQYQQMATFIASNSGKSTGGGTSTSTSTRTILGADGQWHTVTSTTTKPTAPTANEVEAYRKLQVQMADARTQMAEIEAKMATMPGGGFVSTQEVISYYTGQQGSFARGSSDWYAIQGKIDSLTERLHSEQVLAQQGIRITYPGGGGTAAGGGGGGMTTQGSISIDQFMSAIASVESGGRYDARNASSGAYGKYQIMPANWPAWASKYLGNPNAPQTPENQEAVAKAKMLELYKWLGSWEAVAHWWLTGNGSTDPKSWSTSSTAYVNKVMANLGVRPITGAGTAVPQSTAGGGTGGGGGGTTTTTRATSGGGGVNTAIRPGISGQGILSVVTGTSTAADYEGQGTHYTYQQTGFPANMDSRSFSSFYTSYERAYQSGAETFSVTDANGNVTSYFIGSTPEDRLTRMQQLDDLRIKMLTTRADAYSGTASEITIANQLNEAYKDAAAHDYQVLATTVSGSWATSIATGKRTFYPDDVIPAGANVANPLYAGEQMIDRLMAAHDREVQAAKEAWARGDYKAAWTHLQLANHTFDGDSLLVQSVGNYLAQGQAMMAGIAAATGVSIEEALGSKATDVLKSMERLQNLGGEVAQARTASGYDELAAEMARVIKGGTSPQLDGNGNIQLADGYQVFVSSSGAIDIKPLAPSAGYDPRTGGPSVTQEGTTKVFIDTGSTVLEAYAQYQTGPIGSFITPDGTPHELMGKYVVLIDKDGQRTINYQNPFTGNWSNSPIKYNAPAGLTEVGVVGGASKLVLTAPMMQTASGVKGVFDPNDDSNVTYEFIFDKATGTYQIVRKDPGSAIPFIGRAPSETVLPLGQGNSDLLTRLADAGFAEQQGDPVLGNTPFPMIGFTGTSAKTYLHIEDPKPFTPVWRGDPGFGRDSAIFSGPIVLPTDPGDTDPNWVHPDWAASHPEILVDNPQFHTTALPTWTPPAPAPTPSADRTEVTYVAGTINLPAPWTPPPVAPAPTPSADPTEPTYRTGAATPKPVVYPAPAPAPSPSQDVTAAAIAEGSATYTPGGLRGA